MNITMDYPVVDVEPDMMHRAMEEAELLKRQWGANTTDFNRYRDVVGSLGEQAFLRYLESVGLKEGVDFDRHPLETVGRGGDFYDFRFFNGSTVDVKTSTGGYDLLVKVKSALERPCSYYVAAVLWCGSPLRVCLVGYVGYSQVLNRKPKLLRAWDYVVEERYLKNVDFFKDLRK